MAAKSDEVTLWLKKKFGEQPIPQYEVNTRTTELLYQQAQINKARDRDVSLLIKDLKQKTAEYGSEASYLQDFLMESVGLSFTSLSSTGSGILNALVDSAMVLNTKDTSSTSYAYAINDLTTDLLTAERRRQKMDQELTELKKKLTAALVLEKSLEEDLVKTEDKLAVETARTEVRIQNVEMIKAKLDSLRFKSKAAEKKLSDNGMNSSLSHQSLVHLSEKLAKLKEETVPLKKKLESYLDLTPNPSLAQVKIEEAKRELAALEAELDEKVDVMEFSLPEQYKRRIT
ncbi:HAUS augmin-like complex subunit 1 [Latimeria chalumnae]|uniref:HAUS augmin like complex subunit 1 n=1 Tax=Latimeria chalumnae TaxID=7897 RepID=H2ZXE4_LATCH|nr:PREDICTED: HAUS augmin-like complex subunit 1 [Latimeria chalumnae]|eukprot:XP_006011288.1 PREDICTED: HAUS augmin-like complex subunit 1 [Latimeria chalumnae]